MQFTRSSGVLLHPTSLPGRFGIGDLGPEAHRWVDFLHHSGAGLWQVLPLGPTGYADSPYQSFSALAGSLYLISPEQLLADGLLEAGDLANLPEFPETSVDFGALIPWKLDLLSKAYNHFKTGGLFTDEFRTFCGENADWLENFALFMALKDIHDLRPWVSWEPALRQRDPDVLEAARKEHAEAIDRQRFYQFVFFRQWLALRQYANQKGIKIVGDIPIYVAHDSSEVWANPELFYLNEDGSPVDVAGVPPDYFSATGQLWGNPLYHWARHSEDGYAFWLARMKMVLRQVDIVRLDHFRGFAAYYAVPGNHITAQNGEWKPGPGAAFFEALRAALGSLPLIAEDLGVITPDVVDLRERFELPGMKIFQFGLEGDLDDPFLPHNYPENCVAYTGTHDNETAHGWYQNADQRHRAFARDYLAVGGENIGWDMIVRLWESPAVFAFAPLQDFLGIGDQGRMNLPGTTDGNWRWRMEAGALGDQLSQKIGGLNRRTGRSI